MAKCPFCERIVGSPMDQRTRTSVAGEIIIWSCPFCRSILGITKRD